MSNELGENEIDDIFKKAIEPANTEPSERFWQNAAEGVISRGSKLTDKNTSRWRAIAFILGASLLTLGYFFYKMENRLNTVEQQMANIKTYQAQIAKKENTNVSANSTGNETSDNPNKVTKNNRSSSQQKQIAVTNSNTVVKHSPHYTGTRVVNNANYSSPVISPAIFDIKSHIDKQHEKAADPITYNTINKIASTTKEETKIDNSTKQENINNSLPSNVSSPVAQVITPTNPQSNPNGLPYVLKQTQTPANDTSKAIQLTAADTTISKFSISAFFSPDFMMGYKFKTTTSLGRQIESAIKTDEKQNFSYTVGIKAEYSTTSRFSISLGITYEQFSFNTNPGIVYAQKQSDGDVGYSITTSSGVVECPYYGKTKVGDSLKMSLVSTRTYLGIPLQLKYNFIYKEKYKIYLNVGLEANICMAEKTIMNWQDFWNESGVATENETEGSESLYTSYYIGLGADYKIGKYLSLYAEPGLHEAITSLDNNTSAVVTYPQLFSITAGLTYHIK
jgi:hypothetical protein